MGGEILFIEATRMPGSGELTLTGQLGNVMKESAQIAFNWLRSNTTTVHTHTHTHTYTHLPSLHTVWISM